MKKNDEITIGPLLFEVLNEFNEVGVSTEEEYCGLLDNFYERHWEELKIIESNLNLYNKVIEAVRTDSLASDGWEMIEAAMRQSDEKA